jgi:ribonuclease J
MNCMSIESDDQRLLVDCGVTFPDQPFGIDVIRPDFRYLSEHPKRRSALWITHGHEDHIGAVPYLLREHPMPVYATKYALSLLRERFAEMPARKPPTLIEVRPGVPVDLGDFQAEAIRVTHSIADATSLALHTRVGTIIHTGDFKIDETPSDGEHFDAERFRALGDRGVRLLLSDSTNIDTEGMAGSELPVGESLAELAGQARGRLIIVMFASNTHRLRAVIDVARRTGRKLCWLGRSVQTHARVATGTGYLDRADDVLISPEQAAALPRHRVLIAATGSQAEHASALARLARRAHPHLALEGGDTVIFSSRIIPGNERPVLDVMNKLERMGVEVIERRQHPGVHVSGHAHRGEQRKMLELVRPHSFIPVHGTYHHLKKHAQLALDVGVAETLLVENGDLVEITRDRMHTIDRVTTGRVHVARGIDVSDEVVADRERLAEQGAIAVSLTIDEQGRLTAAPDITARGVAWSGDFRELLSGARVRLKRALRDAIDAGLQDDREELRDELHRVMTRHFYGATGQRVVCLVLINVVRE